VNKKPIKSDLKRLDAMRDKDIDYSEIPEFDDEFLRSVEMKISPGKKPVALRLDADVLEWMKSQGKGYQSRINAILRSYYETHRHDDNSPKR
jgi:uncharacterized protein (DUF4415 family)